MGSWSWMEIESTRIKGGGLLRQQGIEFKWRIDEASQKFGILQDIARGGALVESQVRKGTYPCLPRRVYRACAYMHVHVQ